MLAALTGKAACLPTLPRPGALLAAWLALACAGLLGCSATERRVGTAPSACEWTTELKLEVVGGFALNSQSPHVALTPAAQACGMAHGAYKAARTLWLIPVKPPIAVSARNLCSSKRDGDRLALNCLDDRGVPRAVDVAAGIAAVAHQTGVPRSCVVVHDHIGARDLEAIHRRWHSSVGECSGDSGPSQKITIVLEISGTGETSTYRTYGPDGESEVPGAESKNVHLVAPELGFHRELGRLEHWERCRVDRNGDGLAITCGLVNPRRHDHIVYAVGQTLFFKRVAATAEDAHAIAIESATLPCGTVATLEARDSTRDPGSGSNPRSDVAAPEGGSAEEPTRPNAH